MILSGRGRNAVNMRKNLDKRDKNRYIYIIYKYYIANK